jgi:hypothetical protein
MVRSLWWLAVVLVAFVLPVVSLGGAEAPAGASPRAASWMPTGETPDRPAAPPLDPSTDGEGSDGELELDQDSPDPFQASAYDAVVPPAKATAQLALVGLDPTFELVTTSLYRPPRV